MIALTAFLLAAAVVQAGSIPRAIPEDCRDRVAVSLQLAGANSRELEEALVLMGDELWDDGCFLLANLPYRDLGTITADLILENLRWTHTSRDSLPWGASIPAHIYRHYVLPYRVSQERLTKWRKALFTELYPVVRDAGSMTEAALRVNKWVGSKVRFEPTEARDQSPLTTLERGVGRCEELTILCVSAARAVCIPARSCWTPWWAVNDNNHAWVEVWVDGAWHYLGAAEPADSLDVAWFTDAARRAAAVYSPQFGSCEDPAEPVYRSEDRYCIVNSLATYAPPCSVTVRTATRSGEPVEDATVYASVFNWGQFMPVARMVSDCEGRVLLILGQGDYVVTAGSGRKGACEKVAARRGSPISVTLELSESVPPPQSILWLRYPEDE